MTSIDERCASHFSPLLQPIGFSGIRPRRWVRGTKAPLREIFEIQALKGGLYSARWGFSLDFVPLWRNGFFRWKRTDRAAEFDLCIDPIDETGSIPGWCSFMEPSAIRQGASALAKVAPRAVVAALEDFNAVPAPQDIPRLFETRARMRFRRFGLDNHVQTHLAWGLSLMAVGQSAEAERHIARFCDDFGADPADPLLTKAVAMAGSVATGSGA